MGGDPLATVETRVREEIRRRGVDPVRQSDVVRTLVDEVLTEWDQQALAGAVAPVEDRADAARTVLSNVAGLGPLQQYLDDPDIEEIWINRPSQVFIARHGVAELTPTMLTDGQVRDLVEHMLKLSGRRLDLSSPFVDASLPGGERLHAVIPDVTREHWSVNIRKYVARANNLGDLVALGTLTEQAAAFLDAAVVCGLNILIAGGTQAGNATRHQYTPNAVPSVEGQSGRDVHGVTQGLQRNGGSAVACTLWRHDDSTLRYPAAWCRSPEGAALRNHIRGRA